MSSVNKVLLVGRLGAPPELRRTKEGTAVCNFPVATSRYGPPTDGERKEVTCWHRVVVFGKQAEASAQHLTKGRQVYVEGRLDQRSYEDRQGITRYVTEIVASNVVFIGARPEAAAHGAGLGPPAADSAIDHDAATINDLPF